MKSKFLPLILGCLLATSVSAHRDDYFAFTMGDNPANDGWSITGGTGESYDGMYVVTATGGESVIWTRDLETEAGTKDQPYVSRAILKYVSGTGTNGAGHIIPKVILEGYNGESVTFTFKTAPDDDSNVVVDTTGISEGAAFTGQVRYIKVVFENPQPNELISFGYIDLASQWFVPQVEVDKTIYVQAEDYNEYDMNNRKAYSPITGGTNYYRPTDNDMYLAWQDDGAFFQSWSYGNGHYDNWYGFAVKNMCQYAATWDTYHGDYVDATSNKITEENAVKNWGAWLEYSFDVPVACVADISLKAGSHWAAYAGVSGGTGKFGVARANGGYTIDGMSEDWVKRYCASAVVSLDGANLRTNWSSYPKDAGLSQLEYAALASDPSLGWTSTQIEKDGVLVNSDTLHVFPNPLSGSTDNPMYVWSTYYKSDLFTSLEKETGDPSLADYIKPDYANVYLSAGRHTLKVQSLAPMWHFDEMKIEAKQSTAVKDVTTNSSALIIYPSMVKDILHIKGEEVNYNVVDLGTGSNLMSGFGNTVDVSKLSSGVYVIKVGENVQRFIKK